MITAWLSLGTLVLYAGLAFGLRSWLHWRRTGSAGFRGISGRVGSAEWIGGALLVLAVVLTVASPVLVLTGVVVPWNVPPVALALGEVLVVVGLLGTLAAQLFMGDSWRIGVDTSERTALVTSGVFAFCRNPIFTSTLSFLAGLAIAMPTPTAALAFVLAFAGLELQVRLVEEPYLLKAHGTAYARYTASVGRFVPFMGRGARP